MQFPEIFHQQEVGLLLILGGLVDNLLEHHQLSFQAEDILAQILLEAFLLAGPDDGAERLDGIIGTALFFSKGEDCIPVHQAHLSCLLQLKPKFPVLFLEILDIESSVVSRHYQFK